MVAFWAERCLIITLIKLRTVFYLKKSFEYPLISSFILFSSRWRHPVPSFVRRYEQGPGQCIQHDSEDCCWTSVVEGVRLFQIVTDVNLITYFNKLFTCWVCKHECSMWIFNWTNWLFWKWKLQVWYKLSTYRNFSYH